MYQSITLVGRTTSNARLNFTATGTPVANFQLAINRRRNPSRADFIPCVIWGDEAKDFTNKIGKGSTVLLEGELRSTTIPQEEGKANVELQFEVSYFKAMGKPKPITQENGSQGIG